MYEHNLIASDIAFETSRYEERKAELNSLMKELIKEHNQAIHAIQKRCESIGHVDDGGFMYGSCKYCGLMGG